MAGPLKIDFVSDLVCPWCLIGLRRLELALKSTGVEADVELHPFLLDPSAPPEGHDLRQQLRRKFGDPEPLFRRVEAVARADGIPLDYARVQRAPSTLAAHTLIRAARARGTQLALGRALFAAYFLEGRDLSDPAELASVAGPFAFTPDEVRAIVSDPAELDATRAEVAAWSARGVSGVPLTLVGGRRAIPGAQPLPLFERALREGREA